jgi:multidrug efflux pump subunit AcrA (membrane-fusion protein)
MKRKITIVAGILIIISGFYGSKMIMNSKVTKTATVPKTVNTVFTLKTKNQSIEVQITENGRLVAKNKADLYAEVQGIMEPLRKEFKPGVKFNKGDVLVKIRSNDSYARLLAQKSALQNLITSILPDLRLDYPKAYPKWNSYVSQFDMDKRIVPLPKPSSDREKHFITGKNIYTTFYNTKNLELIQSKYTITAPFSGILTEALINPGTVVRPGQKLGEIIDPSIYELEVAISQTLAQTLSVGRSVQINNPNKKNQQWRGKITRINGKVEATTQTVKVYIELRGENLREGTYLEAIINGEDVENAIEIDRKLLVEGGNIFIVENKKLKLISVEIAHKNTQTVLIKGIKNGTEIVSKIVPGAFEGMDVEIYSNN